MIGSRGQAPADPDRFAWAMQVATCPRASAWDPVWVWHHQMGPINLWLAELLAAELDLRPDTRLLDMGCGAGATSMFLAMEYGVQVWAADLWIDPTDNLARLREAGLDRQVFPLRVDASKELPFADDFFDVAFSVDAYHYFGMGEDYLPTYVRVVRPGGQIGVIVPGDSADSHEWEFRSARWWRSLWEKSGVVDISVADDLPGGHDLWLRFLEASAAWTGSGDPHSEPDAELLFSPGGSTLGFTRLVGIRTPPPDSNTQAVDTSRP